LAPQSVDVFVENVTWRPNFLKGDNVGLAVRNPGSNAVAVGRANSIDVDAGNG